MQTQLFNAGKILNINASALAVTRQLKFYILFSQLVKANKLATPVQQYNSNSNELL